MIPTLTPESVLYGDSPVFRGVFQKRDLSKKDKTMMFETHCMSCPYTELLLFKYANINSISHYRAPLSKKKKKKRIKIKVPFSGYCILKIIL